MWILSVEDLDMDTAASWVERIKSDVLFAYFHGVISA